MKLKFILTLLIITTLSCKKSDDVTFTISNVKEIDFEGRKFQLIKTNLTNNTKNTLQYYSMSCSYQDFYFLYGQELFFDDTDCDKNMPIIITLLPNESKEVQLKLRKSPKIVYGNIKIGFFLYKVDKEKSYDDNQINLKKNLIVSNPISF